MYTTTKIPNQIKPQTEIKTKAEQQQQQQINTLKPNTRRGNREKGSTNNKSRIVGDGGTDRATKKKHTHTHKTPYLHPPPSASDHFIRMQCSLPNSLPTREKYPLSH